MLHLLTGWSLGSGLCVMGGGYLTRMMYVLTRSGRVGDITSDLFTKAMT